MPVIVNSGEAHPFLPSVGHPSTIERLRAERQDIRPLEIAILNLMADKQATERQLAIWLGNSVLQVRLTFVATDSYIERIEKGYQSRNTPTGHIADFYKSWSQIKGQKFDGLIITGVNAKKETVTAEDIWPEVQDIMKWSDQNVFSSLMLCWGAKAALKYFHDIDSYRGPEKLFGLFQHDLGIDSSGLLEGFPDRFIVPVSRWKSPDVTAVTTCPALEIVATSVETGPNILAEPAMSAFENLPYAKRAYILNHPEYDTETLQLEYLRDAAANPTTPLPRNYFLNDDTATSPVNTWRHTGMVYSNWLKMIYEAVPFGQAI